MHFSDYTAHTVCLHSVCFVDLHFRSFCVSLVHCTEESGKLMYQGLALGHDRQLGILVSIT